MQRQIGAIRGRTLKVAVGLALLPLVTPPRGDGEPVGIGLSGLSREEASRDPRKAGWMGPPERQDTPGRDPNASFTIQGMAAPSDVEFTAKADGSRQRYVEFLPLGYTSNKTHSLMIFLHGHGSDRWQITQGHQWREIQAVCDVAPRHGMILLSPDYRATTSWMGPAAEADLVQIIQEQKTRRSISRIFLCGGSMGGTSVLIFTALHPELVHGAVSLNGTANLMEYAGFPEAIAASYGGTRTEKPHEYRKRSPELTPNQFSTMPVALTAGGSDTVVPPQSVLRLSKALEKQNPGNVLMLYRETGGHNTSYEDAAAALEFVIERASKSNPKSAAESCTSNASFVLLCAPGSAIIPNDAFECLFRLLDPSAHTGRAAPP